MEPTEDGELGGAPEAAAGAQEPPKKKTKLLPGEKRLKGVQTKVTTLSASLAKKEEQIAVAMSRDAAKPLGQRELDTLALWRTKAEKLSEELEAAIGDVEQANVAMAAAVEAAQQKEDEKAQKEKITRALSEPGAIRLVELWASPKYQQRLNNTSDTVQSVFEHIHADFVKAVHAGDLPSTDERGIAALRKKFDGEWGEFKLWCSVAQRAIEDSGVPADEVEEKVDKHRRATTSIFVKAGMFNHGMAVPPHRVNGGNAARGGEGNQLRELGKATAGRGGC